MQLAAPMQPGPRAAGVPAGEASHALLYQHLLLKEFSIAFIVLLTIKKHERKVICGTGVGKDALYALEVMKNSMRN